MTPIPRLIALVPMRHHSVRVPEKNYRPLAGKPLFHHILTTLLAVPEIDEIVVDTDSPPIVEGIRKEFPPKVRVLERPEHLRDGGIPMNEILLYDTARFPAEWYLQTHSTNPLLRAETISRGINQVLGCYPSFDTLFSVTRLQTRLWDSLSRPINHNPSILLRTQDLPPVYEENSCLYLFTRATLEQRRNRIGERPLLFEIDPDEAWDIDEEIDFEIAEFLAKKRAVNREP